MGINLSCLIILSGKDEVFSIQSLVFQLLMYVIPFE
jgi:hypothetical protein